MIVATGHNRFVATANISALPETAPMPYCVRVLGEQDIPDILALQDAAIGALTPQDKHFLKRRTPDYLARLLVHGLGMGIFSTSPHDGETRLVAQALLRRQSFAAYELNCNVNHFLSHLPTTQPNLAARMMPELQELGWSVVGTMLVSRDDAYLRKGLARQVIGALVSEYQQQGGKYLFASTALDNVASQKVFAHHHFARLAEAVDPKDGWRCVILQHPPLRD